MREIITGIDIGSHEIRVLICEHASGRIAPKIVGMGVVPSRGVQHGYITDKGLATSQLRKALDNAERQSGISIKNALVSIGGITLGSETIVSNHALMRPDRGVTASDIEQLLEQAEQRLLSQHPNMAIVHVIPQTFRVDGKISHGSPIGTFGQSLQSSTLFVTAKKKHLEDLVDTVSRAGVRVTDVVASPIASAETILDGKQKNVGSILLDIGGETTTMAVFEMDKISGLRVFPLGSSHVTNDIALGFQIPLAQAERIKTGKEENTHYSRSKLDEIIEARLSDIFEVVQRSLEGMKKTALLPGGIVIIGGGSSLSTIEEFSRATLRIPAKARNISSLGVLPKRAANHAWLTAYGLCLYGLIHNKNDNYSRGRGMFSGLRRAVRKILEQILP